MLGKPFSIFGFLCTAFSVQTINAQNPIHKVSGFVAYMLNHFPYLNFFVSPYRSPYLAVLASGNWRHKKFSNLKNQNRAMLDFHLLRTAFAVEGQSCKRSQNTCFLGKTVLYVWVTFYEFTKQPKKQVFWFVWLARLFGYFLGDAKK